MDTKLTISIKGLLVAGVAVLALLSAYLLGGAGDGAAAAAEEDGDARTLTMRATGEAVAVPDQATFDVSVHLKRPALEGALEAASTSMGRVLSALEKHGVARKDVQTTGLSMSPVYEYPREGPRELTGYRVSQRAAVLVRELKSAGRAVSAAVAAGGNAVRVGELRLKVGDPEAALTKARATAVEQATTKAEEYAAAAGQDLGAVITLLEVGDRARSAIDDRMMELNAFDAARTLSRVPVRAGRSDLRVTVEVVWEFA